MAKLALYRKYRPRKFSELLGQDHVIKTLLNAIREDKISHAYIFTGPRGVGKTSVARLLATSINCEKPAKGEACGTCSSCQNILENKAVDVLEIDAASNRGIEEIREHKHILTPGRYVGAEAVEDDGEPFEEKMKRLVTRLREQTEEARKLDEAIWTNLKELGYGK